MNDIAQHDLEWNDRLQDLLDGDLSNGERASVESHVAGCARCRSQLAQLKRIDVLMRSKLEAPNLHPSFDQQLFARIGAMDAQARDKARKRIEAELRQDLESLAQGWRRNWITVFAGAIAGIALAVALMVWADAAGISTAIAGLAQSRTGVGSPDLMHSLVTILFGAGIGAVVSRWLVRSVVD